FYHSGEFDKALVDTPCSSERHLIHQNKTSTWSPKRSRYLSIKQYTLLCAALLCCKPGATIVYSTCSINPVENDDVIARLLKKKKDKVSLLSSPSISELGSEPTKYGQIILPD